MKIAATYENGDIFQHFGHTENFKLYDIEDGKVTGSEVVNADGFGHESLADFLVNNDVKALICGGIGPGAINALSFCGIEVYAGVSGNADTAVEELLNGTLAYGRGANCDHHGHGEHQCGNHGCGHKCH